MKKVVLLCALLTGCYSMSAAVDPYVGRPIEVALGAFGVPEGMTQTKDLQFVSWRRHNQGSSCVLTATVNAGLITKFTWNGTVGACALFY